MTERRLTLRLAGQADTGALRRLAALDSAHTLRGHVLVAETDKAPVAAISLTTGRVTADPFQHSADAIRVLRLRRYQLVRQSGDAAPSRHLLRRLVPNPGH